MGLRINTNVAALNTGRILRRSTTALNRSLERLSNGLRISRARDDAAGLAVAEGFRSQVLGAQAAQRNAQDCGTLRREEFPSATYGAMTWCWEETRLQSLHRRAGPVGPRVAGPTFRCCGRARVCG